MNINDNLNLNIPILGCLVNQPKHGYELFKDLSDPEGIGQVYRIKIGRMYAILKKLEEGNLIKAQIEKEGNRPPKKTYYITKRGKESFNDWMDTPIKHGRDFRILFLIKLFFIKRIKEISEDTIFLAQKAECKRWMHGLKSDTEYQDGHESFERVVNQFRISQIKGYIQWIKWCEKGIKNQ